MAPAIEAVAVETTDRSAPAPVLLPVHGGPIRSPVLDGPWRPDPSWASIGGDGTVGLDGDQPRGVAQSGLAAALIGAIVVINDPVVVLGAAAVAAGLWRLHQLDRGRSVALADGFIGFRGDPDWPRGVQEDDDVHWHWQASPG